MSKDEKNLENNRIDDELLEEAVGGVGNVKKIDNLLYKNKDKKKISNTLYSGQPVKASGLVYKEGEYEEIKDNGPTFC